MKAVQFAQCGQPEDVLEVAELPDPSPGPGQVVVRMAAVPINPADLLQIAGKYGVQPDLPHIAGLEGVGRVEAVGPDVQGLPEGTLVMPFATSTWQQRMLLNAAEVFPLPDDIDLEQAAMLKVNPATAELLLTSVVELQPGDWIVQNAANSGVGRHVVQLAKTRSLRTLNIVRREPAVDPLRAIGADAVVVHDSHSDDPNTLIQRARHATEDAPIRLGFDAVAGPATATMARLLAPGATLLNYGGMSMQPCQVRPPELIFRDIRLRGFWVTAWLNRADASQITQLYQRLAGLMTQGLLHMPVAARYPLEHVRDAIAHASREGRDGKILLKL